MSEFICKDCKHDYGSKRNLERHKNSYKGECKYIKNNICTYCKKKLSNNSSLNRHKKTCSKNPANKVDILTLGKENLDMLNEKTILSILSKGQYAIQLLFKKIHCNKKIPENHNIQITNPKDYYMKCYNGKKWIPVLIFDFIEKQHNEKKIMLFKYSDKLKEKYKFNKVKSSQIKKFIQFISDWNESTNSLKIENKINKQIISMIYKFTKNKYPESDIDNSDYSSDSSSSSEEEEIQEKEIKEEYDEELEYEKKYYSSSDDNIKTKSKKKKVKYYNTSSDEENISVTKSPSHDKKLNKIIKELNKTEKHVPFKIYKTDSKQDSELDFSKMTDHQVEKYKKAQHKSEYNNN